MQNKFDTCLHNLITKRDEIEKKQIIKNTEALFFQSANNQQLKLLDACRENLLNYKLNTLELMEKRPENKLYYKAHLNAVTNLLEKLASNNYELEDNDYTLVVDVKYNLNSNEIKEHTTHYAMIGAIIGASIGCIIWIVCLSVAVLPCPPLALFAIPVMLGYLVTFLSVGAALGAVTGAAVSECVTPFIKTPLAGNPYADGNAFDLSLLKNASRVIADNQKNQYSEGNNII